MKLKCFIRDYKNSGVRYLSLDFYTMQDLIVHQECKSYTSDEDRIEKILKFQELAKRWIDPPKPVPPEIVWEWDGDSETFNTSLSTGPEALPKAP